MIKILIHFTILIFLYSSSFSGESEIARIVSDESTVAGEEAKKFLEDVRVAFPQVVVTMFFYHFTQIIMVSLIISLSKS